jgi:hypothetical protein
VIGWFGLSVAVALGLLVWAVVASNTLLILVGAVGILGAAVEAAIYVPRALRVKRGRRT